MKKLIRRLAMVAASLTMMLSLSATSSLALNLVANGGFETGDFSGWTINGSGIQISNSLYSGNYAAYMGTANQLGSLSQAGINTIVGQNYQLNFALNNSGGTVNQFAAIVNGDTLFSQEGGGWQPFTVYTFDFIANTNLTDLVFMERNDPGGFTIDNISVELAPIPEPSTLLLLGIGLLGASFLRKRIRS